MSKKILISDNGKIRDAEDVELVETVLKLKNQGEKWAAIDLLLRAWSERAGDEVKALEIEIKDFREQLVDKKYGVTKGGKQVERRFTLTFPQRLMMMIRAIYKADELEFDSEFFREFVKRYPWFKVAEKN